jgi:hypothetical protein
MCEGAGSRTVSQAKASSGQNIGKMMTWTERKIATDT